MWREKPERLWPLRCGARAAQSRRGDTFSGFNLHGMFHAGRCRSVPDTVTHRSITGSSCMSGTGAAERQVSVRCRVVQ
jgi:hypothetical protein